MAKIEKYGAAGVYDPPGYSQGIRVTGAQTILFTAGQVPYDANGGVKHRGDFKAQARAVFAAIQALVEAGGGTLDHVVKITTYVTDVRYRLDFRSVREEFFGPRVRPPRWWRSARSPTRTISSSRRSRSSDPSSREDT